MAQWFKQDQISKILKIDDYRLSIESAYLRIGGKAYKSSNLNLDIRNLGFGGLDRLPAKNSSIYNIFLVYDNYFLKIIASTEDFLKDYPISRIISKFTSSSGGLIEDLRTNFLEDINLPKKTFNANLINGKIVPVLDWNDSPTIKTNEPNLAPPAISTKSSFSKNNRFLATAHDQSPFVSIYENYDGFFKKLPNPSTLPVGIGTDVCFSSDNRFLVVTHGFSPFVTIYEISIYSFNKLSNLPSLPSSSPNSCIFSSDDRFLVITHANSPFLSIYQRFNNSFSKIPDPSILPSSDSLGASFSPDGKFLAVASREFPYLTIYQIDGVTFTKLPNLDSLPAGTCSSVDFSHDSKILTVTSFSNPFLIRYSISNNTFTRLNNLEDQPNSALYEGKFSEDGRYFVASGNSILVVYSVKGIEFIKFQNPPGVFSGFFALGSRFSSDNRFLAVSTVQSPYLVIYESGAPAQEVKNKSPKILVSKGDYEEW
jgi:hypothetical protein